MDLIMILRIVLTVLSLGVFIGVMIWVYSPKRRSHFEKLGQSLLFSHD
jgi:cbb3-type cytochrome oxidase subunit 3